MAIKIVHMLISLTNNNPGLITAIYFQKIEADELNLS